MDSYEATRIVFSKIQSLDPENASKIMGYVLIQDHGDKEMIRLALGPEALLHQLIVKAKSQLGLVSPANPSSSPFSRVSRPNPLSIPHSASRFAGAGNGGFDVANPSSPAACSPWPLSGFSDLRSPVSPSTSLSYASVVNGAGNSCSGTGSCLGSSAFPYYGGSGNDSGDFVDEYQLQDRLSFLNDPKGDDFIDYDETHLPQHRRSYSVPGGLFGSSDDPNSGFGWKPCLYFARGFCKNGSSCRFLHGGDSSDGTPVSGSPEQSQEHILRSKSFAAQQQKLAAASQFIAGVGAATFPYSKCVNFLLQQENEKQRSAAAALMIGDEMYKFGRCRPERSDFPVMGLGGIGGAVTNPGSRQIYLTFPADSTFREEDVSNYFSIYGPVHDVRIPYQQKRMFGFVTFLYPETVKLILAKGNPHFVCDSRVLVKPYKEKGKIPDKKLHHMERGDYLACSSPTGLDSRDPFDLNLGARMFYNTQEMLLKRKLEEQVDLQQAIELQERRLMNLHLLDSNHHRVGSPVQSQASSNGGNQVGVVPDGPNEERARGCNHETGDDVNGDSNDKAQEEKPNNEDPDDVHQSMEHNLPDNLFSSPKKSAGDNNLTAFSTSSSIHDHESSMASLKSCFLPMPRFSPGRGTIGS